MLFLKILTSFYLKHTQTVNYILHVSLFVETGYLIDNEHFPYFYM